jgi:NAD(P)-dependent dehydrogenase (short-subunit alcohol dehydrogenase family)
MKFGYKSETGSVVLGLCVLVSSFVIPKQYTPVVLPLWAVVGRLVSRGATNRARPVNDADTAEKQAKARFVMSRDMPLEKRPVAIVTGTNSGIGYWTAVGLAAEGYEVIVTCRSAALSVETAMKIRAEAEKERRAHPKKYAHAPATVLVQAKLPVECDNFDSVRAFVDWVSTAYVARNVQVLVNNAGVMRTDITFSAFHPQLELHTAVNFLGPLLLTELLLPLLEKNGGRVVYVSSEAHRAPQTMLEAGWFSMWRSVRAYPTCNGLALPKMLSALKEVNQVAEKSCGPLHAEGMGGAFARYGTSKLLNTYHAHVIARRYRNEPNEANRVYACSLHPGCVTSNFGRDVMTNIMGLLNRLSCILITKTSIEGAQTSLHCAMCPREELELVAPSGEKLTSSPDAVSPYFVECAEKTRDTLLAYGWDIKAADATVEWGRRQVGL